MECHEDGCQKLVHSRGLCQAHYRQFMRRQRGLQKPGPVPDATKPYSRYNNETTHHGRRMKCKEGHYFDGKDTNGKQTCSVCETVRRNAPCPAGHDSSNKNRWGSCRVCQRVNAPWYRWRAKYFLTRTQIEAMLTAQGYACKICRAEFDLAATYPFCVDHDHSCCSGAITCGKCVRSLLCSECNRLLGAAKDSVATLHRAIEYLESR